MVGDVRALAFVDVRGIRIPALIYGTAWKEERTAALTRDALDAGFRGIDTANQRKHYVEAGVGEALATAGVPRDELFVQTKFTYARGQDHRLPYDRGAPLARQVEQSFDSSLAHLGVDHVDAYLLHGPEQARGWTAADREVWRAIEALHRDRRARLIGVSNVSEPQLAALCQTAEVQPAVVQNRCYARTGWDAEVRARCRDRGIAYQGFSLLTANARELARPAVAAIASRLGATVPQVVFRFAAAVGIVALTGTSQRAHMDEDLASADLALTPDDLETLAQIGR
jgi:diketogulonate reductase-like aldo/keto reductase